MNHQNVFFKHCTCIFICNSGSGAEFNKAMHKFHVHFYLGNDKF